MPPTGPAKAFGLGSRVITKDVIKTIYDSPKGTKVVFGLQQNGETLSLPIIIDDETTK